MVTTRHQSWIEIQNDGDLPADLIGWHLTGDLTNLRKWPFPQDVIVAVDGMLVVFASGRGTGQTADVENIDPLFGNLHTNCQINADGDYLALVSDDGITVVSEFAHDASDGLQMCGDISYGVSQVGSTTDLVSNGMSARVVISDDGLSVAWQGGNPGVNDNPAETAWRDVTTAIGFDTTDQYDIFLSERGDIESQMLRTNASALVRVPFELDDASRFDRLTLRSVYDDGFVAYLNGQEVVAVNAPDSLNAESAAGKDN